MLYHTTGYYTRLRLPCGCTRKSGSIVRFHRSCVRPRRRVRRIRNYSTVLYSAYHSNMSSSALQRTSLVAAPAITAASLALTAAAYARAAASAAFASNSAPAVGGGAREWSRSAAATARRRR